MNEIKKLKKPELLTAVLELQQKNEELKEQLITGAIGSALVGAFVGVSFR